MPFDAAAVHENAGAALDALQGATASVERDFALARLRTILELTTESIEPPRVLSDRGAHPAIVTELDWS